MIIVHQLMSMYHPLAVLTAVTVAIELWRTFLKVKNIVSIYRTREVPPVMNDFITEEDYAKLRKTQLNANIVAVISMSCGNCLKLFRLLTFYDKFIWDYTAKYGKSLTLRAVLHPIFDRFIIECSKVPVAGYKIWGSASPNRMSLSEILLHSIKDIAIGVVCTGSFAIALVLITHVFGKLALPTLVIIAESISATLYVVYITQVLNFLTSPLTYDEVGQNLQNMADKIGYPNEKIRITVSETSWQEVYYYNVLGFQLLVVSRQLLHILMPIQITAVVTQKLGHWKLRHEAISNFFKTVEILGYGYALVASFGNDRITTVFGFKRNETHPYIPLHLTTRYIWPICRTGIKWTSNLVMRACTFRADIYAADHGLYTPLKSALMVMAATYKTLPMFDRWHSAWYYGKPTILERVARLSGRRRHNVEFSGSFEAPPSAPTYSELSAESSKQAFADTVGKEQLKKGGQVGNASETKDPQDTPPEKHNATAHTNEGESLSLSPSKMSVHKSEKKKKKKVSKKEEQH